MKMIRPLLAALLLTCATATQAAPDFETLTYRAYIGGVPLGELDLGIARDSEAYRAQAQFRMATLLRLVFDADVRADVAGRFQGDALLPERFSYLLRDRKRRKERNAEITFDTGGNPAAMSADPPFEERSYDMTLAQAAGAIDPATAVLALSAPRAEPCDIAQDVFDGRKRHRITLRPAEDGERYECAGVYERVAGFKDKYMTPERRSYPFRARFEAAGQDRWRVERVWADTDYGLAVVARID